MKLRETIERLRNKYGSDSDEFFDAYSRAGIFGFEMRHSKEFFEVLTERKREGEVFLEYFFDKYEDVIYTRVKRWKT